MGIINMGPPVELALGLKDRYELGCFVETGTYGGVTAAWAAGHFDEVITIERAEEYYREALRKHERQRIKFVLGDTRDTLKKIIPELTRPALFWLDAHWSGGQTYGANDECPLIEELQIINSANVEHFLLIDDARLFLSPPPRPHRIEQWPTIWSVVSTLQSAHSRYTIIIDDVIVSVPDFARGFVAEFCQEANTDGWIRHSQRQSSKVKKSLGLLYQSLKVWTGAI